MTHFSLTENCPAGIGARVGFASRRTPRDFCFRRCDIFYRFRLPHGFNRFRLPNPLRVLSHAVSVELTVDERPSFHTIFFDYGLGFSSSNPFVNLTPWRFCQVHKFIIEATFQSRLKSTSFTFPEIDRRGLRSHLSPFNISL